MVEKVTVTHYKASDGSLHGSVVAAERHNRYLEERKLTNAIIEVLKNTVYNHHFSTLSDNIIPYNSDYWHDLNFERNQFMEELASLIIDKWDELYIVMENVK